MKTTLGVLGVPPVLASVGRFPSIPTKTRISENLDVTCRTSSRSSYACMNLGISGRNNDWLGSKPMMRVKHPDVQFLFIVDLCLIARRENDRCCWPFLGDGARRRMIQVVRERGEC